MLLHCVTRLQYKQLTRLSFYLHTSARRFLSVDENSSSSSSDDSSSSSSDDEAEKKPSEAINEVSDSPQGDKEKPPKVLKNVEAMNKLNALLLSMAGEDVAPKLKASPQLARPGMIKKKAKEQAAKEEKESVTTQFETLEKAIKSAAEEVATSIGGDVKKTESELLQRLLSPSEDKAPETEKGKPKKQAANLSELLSGMKVDHSEGPEAVKDPTRAEQVRQALSRTQPSAMPHIRVPAEEQSVSSMMLQSQMTRIGEKINLFGSERLGIFQKFNTAIFGVELPMWNKLYERELRLAVTHPPRNYFEEMIMWTDQGKLWKFPIDNEQGLEEEEQVFFAEHVFLEKHLESWCPTKGPIRHFMELVCVGLSKNPYLTVKEKTDHIFWYRDYFKEKESVLRETGAIEQPLPQITAT